MDLTLDDVLDALKTKQVTQAALAEAAGITQAAVSQISTGATRSPTYRNALALIKAGATLGIQPAENRSKTDEKQTAQAAG